MGEVWKDIPGWEGYYQASTLGNIRRAGKQVPLRPAPYGRDRKHLGVSLWRNNRGKTMKVHRLVASTFLGHCPQGYEVCHNDGNPRNNRVENLRYGTPSDNARDRLLHGTHHQVNKTHCPRGHLLNDPNLLECKKRMGYRECKSCNYAQTYLHRRGQDKDAELRTLIANEKYHSIMKGKLI